MLINSNNKEEFQGFSSKRSVYKEVDVPGAVAQSSSTIGSNSIGSSAGIVIPGPVDSTTSHRTPRPLLALAYEKKVQSPIGYPATQFPGTLRGLVTLDWQSTPGQESSFDWSSPGQPGSIIFDVRGGRALHPIREAPKCYCYFLDAPVSEELQGALFQTQNPVLRYGSDVKSSSHC